MKEPEFRKYLENLGYDAPVERVYEPNLSGTMHTHEFSACLLVTSGKLLLALENGTVSLLPGDTCEVVAGVSHDERTDSEGASVLLAKK